MYIYAEEHSIVAAVNLSDVRTVMLVELHIFLAVDSIQSMPIVCGVCRELNSEMTLTVPVTQLRNVLNTACVLQASLCHDTVACTDRVKQLRI